MNQILSWSKSKMNRDDRQFEQILSGHNFYPLPKWLPGRMQANDFVYFEIPGWMEPFQHRYQVVVETLFGGGGNPAFKSIGRLSGQVELPHVHLPTASHGNGRIALVPDSKQLPLFESTLLRGGTYTLPGGCRQMPPPGRYRMVMHGSY